jgi:copper chaperone
MVPHGVSCVFFPLRIIKENKEKVMTEFKLSIDGMHCGACVRRVNQALASIEGIVVNEVRIGEARFTSDLNPAPVDQAIAAVVKAGFAAHLEAC